MTKGSRPRISLPAYDPRRWAILAGLFVAAALVYGSASLFVASQIEATNSPSFCVSCHEMGIFEDTWRNSSHGNASGGVISASCTDCHLPPAEDGLVPYLFTKGISGLKDMVSHVGGAEVDWLGNLEHKERFVYESGCTKCHVDLVAPEIPLKAFRAHKDFSTGQTSSTCVTCHAAVGHGNLRLALKQSGEERLAMALDKKPEPGRRLHYRRKPRG